MQENSIREPIELIDEELDVIAGGLDINNRLSLGIAVDINFAAINQLIQQIQVFGSNSAAPAAEVASISQVS